MKQWNLGKKIWKKKKTVIFAQLELSCGLKQSKSVAACTEALTHQLPGINVLMVPWDALLKALRYELIFLLKEQVVSFYLLLHQGTRCSKFFTSEHSADFLRTWKPANRILNLLLHFLEYVFLIYIYIYIYTHIHINFHNKNPSYCTILYIHARKN